MEAASTLSKTGMIANTAAISCIDGMEKVKFNFHVAWRKNSISRDFILIDEITFWAISTFELEHKTSWLCCLRAFTIKLGALRTMMIQKRWSREKTRKTAISNWCEGNRLRLTQKTFISDGEDEALDSLLLLLCFFLVHYYATAAAALIIAVPHSSWGKISSHSFANMNALIQAIESGSLFWIGFFKAHFSRQRAKEVHNEIGKFFLCSRGSSHHHRWDSSVIFGRLVKKNWNHIHA